LLTGTVELSAGMFRLFGEAPVEGPLRPDWIYSRVPESERAFVQSIGEGVCPGEPCEFQHRIRRADGSLRTVLHRSMAEADESGQRVRSLVLLQDITAQRVAEQQADQLANFDEVTALRNRGSLMDRFDSVLRQARREEGVLAVLLLGVDRLQLVTESLGYAAADSLLLAVAQRLSGVAAASHTTAHLGSGEFAVLLVGAEAASEEAALALSRSVVDAISQPLLVGDTEVDIPCSVGVARFPVHGDNPDDLLHRAQAARLRAKEQGDNQIALYSAESHSRSANQLAMAAALRRAVEREEFLLYYQPQVDLLSGQMNGMEVLLRWPDGEGGFTPPDVFIPVAEETGLIRPLGEWVIATACRQGVAWQRAGLKPLRMAINLSVRQLQQPDFARRVQAILLDTGEDPRHLGFEITESLLMDESEHIARTLGELQAMGIEISLDDFGTGYSNLSYLRRLPIDLVKVDRSFVHDVTAAPEAVSMTRAVIKMAHSLQMRVLAEGVESSGQLSLLIANHCDRMQGYFFSPPLPADEMAALMREGRRIPEHLLARKGRERTLLLVDDEENIVASLKRLLRREGYHIVTANSGPQGLQRLADHAVDVIVSDQRMPGMTGVEFLRRAKELCPDTVRMVLSGYTELQSITDAINEGAIFKFLTKPWDDERLRGHIADAFRYKEMVDENHRLDQQVRWANQELVLGTERERAGHEEAMQLAARDVLDHLPAPVIGLDEGGVIVFINATAEGLLGQHGPLVGSAAAEVLPQGLRELCIGAEAESAVSLHLAGRPYQAVCRELAGPSPSRGRVLVLSPGLTH
jgi:diguanylate cyclase (GGDEF)-like protein